MMHIYSKLITVCLVLSCINSYSQNYRYTDTEMKPADMQPNYIGAELPTDKKYYYKTAGGEDSVLLASYTIYHWDKKRVYTLDGTLAPATKPPHFKGTLADGKMLQGELYFMDIYYNNEYLYIGSFVDNKANGLAIYRVTSRQAASSPVECKAFFENGFISKKGVLKLDYDSALVPTLFYNGDIMLGDGDNILIKDGYGSFFRTNYVKPTHNYMQPIYARGYGLGISNAYYEGQITNGLRTGFGIYNTYDFNAKKTTNFKVGLLAADFPIKQFSTLPVSSDFPDKTDERNTGLYLILPEIGAAKNASFIYNGKSYVGMQYNKKPYGFGVMKDADGFYEIGFWKEGLRIPTEELLKKVLPDSGLLQLNQVTNKIVRVTLKYNSKKNEYINEKETAVATISYYGKLNSAGEIEGWGFRTGGYTTEAGYFLPTKLLSNKKLELPKPEEVFKIGYAVKNGNGGGDGYGVQWAKNRFFTSSGFYAQQTVPYGGITLAIRDANTIALSEYRDKRDYEVVGWEKWAADVIVQNKIKQAEKQKAFDALFMNISSPSQYDINSSIGNFYMDRSGGRLYKVISVDYYAKKIRAEVRQVGILASDIISLSTSDFFSSGNFRKVQKYVPCRSCGGKGTITLNNSYTADYEYTFGAKIKYTSSKTTVCGCGCGLEPEQFGAKRDWQ